MRDVRPEPGTQCHTRGIETGRCQLPGRIQLKLIRRAVIAGIAILCFALVAPGQDFSAQVIRILDGDTIEVLHDGQPEKIRLAAIDCPEKKQAFGTRAKQFTGDLAFQKIVDIKSAGQDRYGRTLGEVILPDGRNLNQELVRNGYAWHYTRYSNDATLARLEREAQAAQVGLWADPTPIPPWDYRHISTVTAREKRRDHRSTQRSDR